MLFALLQTPEYIRSLEAEHKALGELLDVLKLWLPIGALCVLALGICLGWLWRSRYRECPFCTRTVPAKAKVCGRCQRDLDNVMSAGARSIGLE